MRTLFLLLLLPACFAVLNSASAGPWYGGGGQAPTIEIFFKKDSLSLKPYYHNHIKALVLRALKNPQSKLMINHKDESMLSKHRAARLKSYLISNFSFPARRIAFLTGLAPRYNSLGGENVVLFLNTKRLSRARTPRKFVSKVKKPVRRFVAAKHKVMRKRYNKPGYEYGNKPKYIYIKRIEEPTDRILQVGLGFARHSFSNTENKLSATHLGFYGQKRLTDVLSVTGDFSYGFSNSSLVGSREYNYALGVLSEFKDFNSKTKLYRRNTWAWTESDSKFVTLVDLGLHQSLDLDLFKNHDFLVNLSVWGELSFSNTVPGLQSTNVLSFSTEIKYEWLRPNLLISLYLTRRKYKVFETSISGLNLGYRF